MDNRFLWIDKGNLSIDFCESMIERYELESFKKIATAVGGYTNILSATKVNITELDSWKDVDDHLFASLSRSLDQYRVFLRDTLMLDFTRDSFIDSGYEITRYVGDNGDRFEWHQDYMTDNEYGQGAARYLSYIWYLNTVDGGETEFVNGFQVKPEAGKLFIFPSTWTYLYREKTPPPKTTKYTCTGFLYAQSNPYINQQQNSGEG